MKVSDVNPALIELHKSILDVKNFVRGVLSGRRRNMTPPHERIDLRPVEIKKIPMIQMTFSDGRQMTTKNYLPQEFPFFELIEDGYANVLLESTSETLSLRFSKKGAPLISKSKTSGSQNLSHDRKKERLLDSKDLFLREVGISDSHGEIKPSMMDKYMQVEEFLRALIPTLKDAISAGHMRTPTTAEPLILVDLGCGHAYLTFAAHQYLQSHDIPVKVVGVDIREASRVRNNEIATKLGISESIEFFAHDISSAPIAAADIVIALHACDTATDDAIAWALNRAVPLVILAPCCHHDIQSQIQSQENATPEPWGLITRHGIMRERFIDLITDALRIELMRLHGYRAEAIEFVGGEHTPRNLMIRAVRINGKSGGRAGEQYSDQQYRDLCAMWGVRPVLEGKLNR